MRTAAALLSSLLIAGCSAFGIRSGTEEPDYQVAGRISDGIEIRRYGQRLAAETSVAEGSEETARNAAFRRLFDYISGANTTNADIAMTAPVQVEAEGTAIAMTTPVQTARSEADAYVMRFFLPATMSMRTAPKPADARIRLVEVPGQTMAVLRFSGSRSASAVAKQRARLLASLESSNWQAKGEVVDWFYDPPWTIPFLRRNEVAVPVTAP
jgi:hypothetical protein